MPTKVNTTQFAASIRQIGNAAAGAQRKAVMEAADMLKRSIMTQTSIATKGSMGFSNMNTRLLRSGREVPSSSPSKLRVGYDIVGERNPTAIIVARGAWGLIEYGSDPHFITTTLPTISRKRKAAARYQRETTQRRLDVAFGAKSTFSGLPPMNGAAGGGTPRYRVYHPGTKGKRPFNRGIDLVRDIASKRAKSVISSEVARTIRFNRQQYISIVGDNRYGSEASVRVGGDALSVGRY